MPRSTRPLFVITVLGAFAVPSQAQIGMVADDAADRVVVFDAASMSSLGPVSVGPGAVGDCAVTPDQSLGVVVDFASNLWLIDLDASPPALADGTNPIALSSPGQDVALTPEGDLAIACGGGDVVSVVDLASRAEIDTFDLGHGCQMVDACADGSVLVGYFDLVTDQRAVRRLLLDELGQLSDSGESLTPDLPTNVHCGPDGTALVLQLGWDVSSVSLAGLATLDTITLGSAPSAAVLSPAGDRIILRAEGMIEAYGYEGATGTFSSSPLLTIPGTGTLVPLGGIDTMVHDIVSNRLLVPSGDTLLAFHANTGASAPPLFEAGSSFTGVCLGGPVVVFADGFEAGGTSAWTSSTP